MTRLGYILIISFLVSIVIYQSILISEVLSSHQETIKILIEHGNKSKCID